MTGPLHTYGPSCLLADEELDLPSLYSLSAPPDIRSHFFYVSSLPIDDPLAPLPASTGQASGNERAPPQPFSARDNVALEAAWEDLRKAQEEIVASKKHTGAAGPSEDPGEQAPHDAAAGRVSAASRTQSNPITVPDTSGETFGLSGSYRKQAFSSSINDSYQTKGRSHSPEDSAGGHGSVGNSRVPSAHGSISGSPFIRAPISQPDRNFGRSVDSQVSQEGLEWQAELRSDAQPSSSKPSGLRTSVSIEGMDEEPSTESVPIEEPQTKIPVGALRLHLVELPNLKV